MFVLKNLFSFVEYLKKMIVELNKNKKIRTKYYKWYF